MTAPALADILAARNAISGTVRRTPLLRADGLSARTDVETHLKLETVLPIGAFKLRGALNAAANMPGGTHTLTCCSTGNHGRAVAWAARRLGLKAVIFMSSLVPETKLAAIRALGAEIRIVGRSQDDAQEACRLLAGDGVLEIPPFDDRNVIAGQGTIGLEILEDLPETRTVLVPLSGGGLAAGVALAARSISPGIRVIGISMDRGAAMAASLEAGTPVAVTEVESLADSLGGGIGTDNRLTFAMCRDLLDDVVLVTEEEIYTAMRTLYLEEALVVEGAAAVGVAACLAGRIRDMRGPLVTIITGRNVDRDQFTRIITAQPVALGDRLVEGAIHDA